MAFSEYMNFKGHEVDDGPYGEGGKVPWTDMLIAQNGDITGIEITIEDFPRIGAFIIGVRFR